MNYSGSTTRDVSIFQENYTTGGYYMNGRLEKNYPSLLGFRPPLNDEWQFAYDLNKLDDKLSSILFLSSMSKSQPVLTG